MKEQKWHIKDSGEPGACDAEPGNCPKGEGTPHYDSYEEAVMHHNGIDSVFGGAKHTKTIHHEMALSHETEQVLENLQKAGFTPYIVGGSVRDSLLSGSSPKDIDIEVFGAEGMDHLEAVLRKYRYRVDSVGKSFGVLKVSFPNGDDLDISLPRRDSKVTEGHRGFEVTVDSSLTLEEAAGRRDFTINSLYYDHSKKKIRDPFGGYGDYREGKLRHINEHFSEDPLRVIRGAQFSARFKMELAEETVELSKKLRTEAQSVSFERLQVEFEKMYGKGDPRYGLHALRETGWDHELGLQHVTADDAKRATLAVEAAKSEGEDPALFGVAETLRNVPNEERRKVANVMLAGEKRQRKALQLLQESSPETLTVSSVRRWARELGRHGLTVKDMNILLRKAELKSLALETSSWESPQGDYLTGQIVLQETDRKPGPWMGKILREASLKQDNDEFESVNDAREWLRERLTQEDDG